MPMSNLNEPNINQSVSRKVITINNNELEITLGADTSIKIPNVNSETFFIAWILSAAKELQLPIFEALTDLLTTHSESYAITVSRAAMMALKNCTLFASCPVSLKDISNFLDSDVPKSYQPFIRPLLGRLLKSNPELLDDQATSFIRGDIKWEEKKNTYFSLMTNCPESGALTDQELHNLHSELNRCYSDNKISQYDFTLLWMFIGTGLRPIQVARMLRSDVVIHAGPEGREVILQVPLAKGEGLNEDKWLRRAPTVLSEALIGYLEATQGHSDNTLFSETTSLITSRFRTATQKLNTWSERLGTKIPMSPYRLRYTLATRALAQGASDWEVARLLTHRSTSCIQFYRASMPELLNPIAKAIGKEMAYFARAFQGRLISSLSEATRKDEGEAEIIDFIHLTRGATIGACGTTAKCYMNAPIACLSCARFEPYKDAPWEELLEKLRADAEKELEERIKLINFNAMSAIVEIMALRDLGTPSNG